MASEKKERTKNGKLRFGVLDAAIIILILAIIASVVLRYTTDNSFFSTKTNTYTVTLKISDVRYTTHNMLSNGDKIYLKNGNALGGITQTSVTPSVYYVADNDEKMTPVYYPDSTFVDIVATVSCELAEKNGRTVTLGGEHIGVGVTFDVHTETVDMTVVVTSVEAMSE